MSSNSSHRKKVQREWRHRLEQGAREAIEPTREVPVGKHVAPEPSIPEVAAEARLRMNRSMSETRALRHRALEFACEHAGPGSYCYRSTKGLCRSRLDRAVRAAADELAMTQSSTSKGEHR